MTHERAERPTALAEADHHRLERLLADVARDLAAVAGRMPRLIDRDHIAAAPDGYPPRGSGAQPSAGPARTRSGGDEHDGASLDYADPVGELAATGTRDVTPDPVSRTVRAIWRRLDCAAGDLLRAAEMARNLAHPIVEDLPHPWCAHHYTALDPQGQPILRPLAWRADRLRWAKDRLCSFCGEHRAAYGALPPLALLEHLERHPGARCTPALIARFVADQPTAASPKERKRKRGWRK
jgi:hypothetical protein